MALAERHFIEQLLINYRLQESALPERRFVALSRLVALGHNMVYQPLVNNLQDEP